MVGFKADAWFPDGQRSAPDDWNLPDAFVRAVNKHWVARSRGALIAVVLTEPSHDSWTALGRQLTDALLAPATTVGIGIRAADSTATEMLTLAAHWTQAGATATGLSALRLNWVSRHHPMRDILEVEMPNETELTWVALQPKSQAVWPGSIWHHLRSDMFSHDGDLLLAAYEAEISLGTASKVSDLEAFGSTLENAQGWLVPIDENAGFTLGLSTRAPAYKDLVVHR